jgi:hypothetical protein
MPHAFKRHMPTSEEYRKRAKEARDQANACRNQWERLGLVIIAEQCERLAAYKDLSRRSGPATSIASTGVVALQQNASDSGLSNSSYPATK